MGVISMETLEAAGDSKGNILIHTDHTTKVFFFKNPSLVLGL